MSFNPFKPLIQKIQRFFLTNIQTKRKRRDEDQECLHLGFCDVQAQSTKTGELYFG